MECFGKLSNLVSRICRLAFPLIFYDFIGKEYFSHNSQSATQRDHSRSEDN